MANPSQESTSSFILSYMLPKTMRLTPVIVSIILASSTLGYGIASAQMAGSGEGTPCTASHPCAKICGDHPCAPGEVYNPGSQSNTKTTASATNGTAPSMQTQMSISDNVTATKTVNGTAVQTGANSTSMQTQMNIAANATATKTGNGTMTSMNKTSVTIPPPAPMVPPPAKQVSSGTAPADVKCPSGYQLVLNKFDSRPACVSPDVMAKLVARGWAA